MKDLAALRGETGSWYHLPLGLLFEISDDHTRPLYMGLSPQGADIFRYQVTDRLISPWLF